jgi:hypothetical protein
MRQTNNRIVYSANKQIINNPSSKNLNQNNIPPRNNNNHQNQINYTNNSSSNKNSNVNVTNNSHSNTSNSKITFNNNSAKTSNPNFRPLSDSRLYEMANQYITTDESLEKFQSKIKNKNGNIYPLGINVNNNNLPTINETLNYNSRELQGNNQLIPSGSVKSKRQDRLSKNIATNLEYYNMIDLK